MKKVFILFTTIIFMFCISISAQKKNPSISPENINSIPSKISYQGVLTDNVGLPQNGVVILQLGLFTAQTGGDLVWSETQNSVHVVNGIFNVYLGASTPLTGVSFDVPYWLQIVVNDSYLPRIELTSSAYSFNTERIQGKEISVNQPNDGQVLKWNSSLSKWEPGTDNTGGGTSYWNLNSNGLYYEGGKVLVGTTTSLGSIGFQANNPYADGVAIAGYDYTGSGAGAGIFGYSNSFTAVQGNGTNAQYAGYFMGKVYISGKTLIGTINSNGDIGLESDNPFPDGVAIAGYDYQNSNGAGVFGFSNGFAGIQGNGIDADYAGYFNGNVHVSGTLSKSGGSFEIDDPRDPANKILRHSFVESPDMMNVYNGNVTTDAAGNAIIHLPNYFEVLNKDFRYQLTVIGQFAEAIVNQEIQNDQFTIKTDKPNVKVSWQVTGIRKDPWAQNNPIIVEEQKKPNLQGYYFNPEVYSLPETKSIEWAGQKGIMKNIYDNKNK